MTGSTLARGARGGGVVVLGQAATVAVQLIGAIVLSRLLTPADFGIVAMAGVLLSLAGLLRDFGLSTAGLQAKGLTQQQASNLFWANATLSLAAFVVVVLCTPVAVALFDDARLWTLVPVLAISLILGGLQVQFQVQLTRANRYSAIALTSVTSALAGLVVAAAMAWGGAGYWALVAQAVASAGTLLLLRLGVARWLPSLPSRRANSRGLLRIGRNVGLANLLAFLQSNVDTVALGMQYGATITGYYNRAFQLLVLPVNTLLGPLTNVVISVVRPGISESDASGSNVLLRAQHVVSTVVIGLFAITAATADWLIPLLLGDQWGPTIGLFQILAIGGAVNALAQVGYWRFILDDRSGHLLMYNIATKPLAAALIALSSLISPTAVAWAYSLVLLSSWPVSLIWLSRTTKTPSMPFFLNGLVTLVAGALTFWAVRLSLSPMAHLPGLVLVIIGCAIGLLVFIGLLCTSRIGRRALTDCLAVVQVVIRGNRAS